MLQALAEKKIGRRDQANNWIWRCANLTREVHEEYAVQRWPETKRLLGLLVNSSGGAHARNARRLVHAARQQDRRLSAALLAAALPHTAEAGEVINGARTRMSRKPAALARELLRNFPKGKRQALLAPPPQEGRGREPGARPSRPSRRRGGAVEGADERRRARGGEARSRAPPRPGAQGRRRRSGRRRAGRRARGARPPAEAQPEAKPKPKRAPRSRAGSPPSPRREARRRSADGRRAGASSRERRSRSRKRAPRSRAKKPVEAAADAAAALEAGEPAAEAAPQPRARKPRRGGKSPLEAATERVRAAVEARRGRRSGLAPALACSIRRWLPARGRARRRRGRRQN